LASSQTPVRRLIDAEQVLGSHEVRTFHSVSVAAVLLTTLVATSGSHALGLQAQSPRHASRTRRVAPDPRPGAVSRGYGWPLRPFNRQHVIRGAFGDPRFGSLQRNFHFGIDIPARGGTPVYAVASGTVFLAPDRVSVLADGRAGHATGFSYWHVLPAVAEYRFVAKHALIGWVKTAWGHLHFAELQGGAWVNPLRVGALTPFRNRQRPHINSIEVVAHSAGRAPVGLLRGRVDVTVDVFAAPPSPPPGQWQSARIVPALLRWRLVAPASRPPRWTTAVDFRLHIPSTGCTRTSTRLGHFRTARTVRDATSSIWRATGTPGACRRAATRFKWKLRRLAARQRSRRSHSTLRATALAHRARQSRLLRAASSRSSMAGVVCLPVLSDGS